MLAGLVLVSNGCREDKDIPDVSSVDASFEFISFDQALFDKDSTATNEQLGALKVAFPALWEIYFTHIFPLAPPEEQMGSEFDQIRGILADPRLRAVADSVKEQFSDVAFLEAELYDAFQHYRYYFPSRRSPNIYTLISDFSFFPFIFQDSDTSDAIGIGLDMFLGGDFPYTSFAGNHPTFSQYLTRTYNKEHITKRTLDILIDDMIGPPPGDRLLDLMIHNGKKLYLLEQLLPATADTVIFEFTPMQLSWCEANERNLWAHYLTEDLLYANEFRKINKLVNPSPNVPGLPVEAPGRVANWSGWRIVHALMERNPELDMTDLIAMRDAQGVLEMARYRPK